MKVSVNLILIRWGVLGDALRAAQTYIEGWEEGANLFKDVDKNGKPTKLEEGESPAVWDPVVWATQNYVAGHNLWMVSMNYSLFLWPKYNLMHS